MMSKDRPADPREPPGLTRAEAAGRTPQPGVEELPAARPGEDRLSWLSRVRDDQRRRWKRGQRLLAETYLQHLPALGKDPETAVDLIYSEFLLREELGETPNCDDYLRRFPLLAGSLRRQFDVHFAMRDAGRTGG